MSSQDYAFAPMSTQTVSLPCTTTSATVALPAAVIAAIAAGSAPQLQIYNSGAVAVFVDTGALANVALVPQGATVGDVAIGPGQTVVLSIANNAVTNVCGICASGTATLYITPGTGI